LVGRRKAVDATAKALASKETGAFFIHFLEDKLSDNPQVQVTNPAVQATATPNETPAQVEGEKFDPERAMALIAKLRDQVKELTPKAKQAEALAAAQKQKEEAEMTELQKLNKRLAETESELVATRRASLAANIAAKVGLPAVFADRLKGETPEDMEADAKAILEALPKQSKPQPGPVANPGMNGQVGETAAQRQARLFGTPAKPFEDKPTRNILWPDGTTG
jgi:hypothetical protein